VTESLNYETPVERAKTPLMAWLSIGLAVLAFLVDVFAVYYVRSTPKGFTSSSNGGGVVLISSPPPMWTHVLQVLSIGMPVAGLILAIIAVRRANSRKAAAIVGIVLNVLILGLLVLIA
jgi:hypothetical protein